MSKKTGRNELCPCGSGRKYKACCLGRKTNWDLEFRKFRQTHDSLTAKLLSYALDDVNAEMVPEAWWEFVLDEDMPEELQPDGSISVLFMPWLLYNWQIETDVPGTDDYTEITIAEQFLEKNAERLNADELELLTSSNRCPFSLCEVVDIKPGENLRRLFDLMRRIEYDVIERTSSYQLKRGEIIYCATSNHKGFKTNVASGPYALQATSKLGVNRLRRTIMEEFSKDKITAHTLHEFEPEIRKFYLDTLCSRFAPPTILNMEGHRVVPQKLYFEIASADETFHALCDLAEGTPKSELLNEAVVEKDKIKTVEIPWVGGTKEARKKLGGPVVMGTLKIDETDQLIIEVNSIERAGNDQKHR